MSREPERGRERSAGAPAPRDPLEKVLLDVKERHGLPHPTTTLRLVLQEGVVAAARAEGCSERTLRRELERSGVGPRRLVAEIRAALLKSLPPNVSDQGLVGLLGLESRRGLARAIRSLTGQPLREYARDRRRRAAKS